MRKTRKADEASHAYNNNWMRAEEGEQRYAQPAFPEGDDHELESDEFEPPYRQMSWFH